MKRNLTTFSGTEVEQTKDSIKLHLDTYIQETIDEYKSVIKTILKPKNVPMLPGVMLEYQDFPETLDPRQQKVYRSFIAKLQFAVTWTRCDIAPCSAARMILRIGRSLSLGSFASSDGVSGSKQELQADLRQSRERMSGRILVC